MLRWIERACYVAGGLCLLAVGPAWTVGMVIGLGLAGIMLLLLAAYLTEERFACESCARTEAQLDAARQRARERP